MHEQSSYLLSCSMKSGEIVKLLQMIASHPEFSEVSVAVNLKRESYLPSQAAIIPKGKALVNIDVPRTTNMSNFFGSFTQALNKK